MADAVLYEGYLLYPYRRSSGKNRVRWQFGVLTPRSWAEARAPGPPTVAGSADAWRQQTDCLLEASPAALATTLRVQLRFLQLQHRSVQRADPDGVFHEVDELEIDGERYLTFDEAVPRELAVTADLADLTRPQVTEIEIPGGEDVEVLGAATASAAHAATAPEPDGATGAATRARVVRTRWPVSARLRLSVAAAPAPFHLHRLRMVTENTATDLDPAAPRPEALRRSLVATHTMLGVRGGVFLSLLDPPPWAAAAVAECANLHTFPVLAGCDGADDVVLSSPIIMYDRPAVAPESPGDLFDATEIDEILSLRTLTLTEEEKREARATDPRAASIIDRVDLIPPEVFARLHGAIRSLEPRGATAPPSPETDGTETDGTETDGTETDGTETAPGCAETEDRIDTDGPT